MAEGSSNSDPEGLERQLESLSSRYSGDESETRSELFCADFCKVVEEYASQWRVPLPQLRILEIALRHFSRASAFFPTSCDHVHRTLGSLALSVFELLLFFDQKEFNEEPLKIFTATFQECHSVLAKYENVFLLQVGRLLQIGGLWTSPALQAILSESSLPQNEVDCYISSEPPAFLELRVRYLSSCGRDGQAAALAKCCVWHPAAGQLLFFLQFYLSWLIKTDQHEHALHIICSLEGQEPDELLLALTTACLSQQLQRGDMFHLCELVLVWTNLHRRLNSSKQTLLEQCHQLMRSATNVKSIFPFIRAVLQEVGEDAVQFCVELCANALRSRLPCDVLTKTLIYKTIAGLLPSDLDVCRVCALLVFFLEPTVEAYKMVYLLYMHPDQEYHVDDSPIGNNIRFETLQVLKKDLYFDPEFWNLFALRTNCLKLMSEKVVSAKIQTTSSTNAREEDTSVVDIQVKKEDAKAHDARSETSENSDLMEMAPETEESKLEHYCTLCSKFFTGARVVEHAMFHFRRDECTFCKAVFKDDLLAMMHLSDHIEKMKRLKAGETGASFERSSHEKQKPKHIDSETSSHRVNGHIGKKNEFIKLKKDSKQESVRQQSPAERTRDGGNNVQRCKISESSTVQIKKELVKSSEDGKKRRESLQLQQESSKQIGGMQKKTDGAPEKMVSCPSQRCTWFADLLKNKVGLLYHALDKHYGDVKPLELAFRVADNKCSICMRVMWSFEHFQHHVERHRIIPRHPCPHRGCKARFKSGMEMRRHARKHSPLQAMCCRPGCSKLFICLWALNLHEREHYASKLAMSDSSSNGQGDEKALKTPHGKKTQRSEHASESTLRKGTKLSEQAKSESEPVKGKVVVEGSVDKKAENQDLGLINQPANPLGEGELIPAEMGDPPKPPMSDLDSASRSETPDEKGWIHNIKLRPCEKTLAAYGKKPYLRLPPTAYLDEKFTTMPKRRKEMPLFQSSSGDVPPQLTCVKETLKRHRCTKCFSTFSSAAELQRHNQLQKCSNLFGFDSDDEGEFSLCVSEF
uniref:Uncharacterized LOC107098794 n=1 Tax=Cyprinodon variegatus TaxID=28743 RepID=A0A3Q2D3L7_CYPVA